MTYPSAHLTRQLFDKFSRKQGYYGGSDSQPIVEIRNPEQLSLTERNELLRQIRRFNFVIYQLRSRDSSKPAVKKMGMQIGLSRLDHNYCAENDSISSVCVLADPSRRRYVPYTSRPLGWHTDGYYNEPDRNIRSFILHCVSPAPDGGVNDLLDPEVVFSLLYEYDRTYVQALFDAQAFSIPLDAENPAIRTGDCVGPVFSTYSESNFLHMRYTARARSIEWNQDGLVREASARLLQIIDCACDFTRKHKLDSHQGVICNNVLHRRGGFTDGISTDQKRLLYRARYYDRILET